MKQINNLTKRHYKRLIPYSQQRTSKWKNLVFNNGTIRSRCKYIATFPAHST